VGGDIRGDIRAAAGITLEGKGLELLTARTERRVAVRAESYSDSRLYLEYGNTNALVLLFFCAWVRYGSTYMNFCML